LTYAEFLRRQRRLTQRQLATVAGVSCATISNLEKGINVAFGDQALEAIAYALQISPPSCLTRKIRAEFADPEPEEAAAS